MKDWLAYTLAVWASLLAKILIVGLTDSRHEGERANETTWTYAAVARRRARATDISRGGDSPRAR
jgi:hypothetical protein